jgi:hypothetical protein
MRVDGINMSVFTTMMAATSGQAMLLATQAIDTGKISAAGWT